MRISIPLGILVVALLFAPLAAAAPDKVSDARKLVAANAFVKAKKLLEDVVSREAKNDGAWALLAEVRLALGDVDGAKSAADQATELVDSNPEYWKLYARTWFEKGMSAINWGMGSNEIKSYFSDAQRWFKRVAELAPNDPEIRCWQGWTEECLETDDKALEFYQEQLEKFPKDAGGYVRLGVMKMTQAARISGQRTPEAQAVREAALEVFDDGIAKGAGDSELYYERGKTLQWLEKYPEAGASYMKAVELDVNNMKAWRNLFRVGLKAGDIEAHSVALLKKSPKAMGPSMALGNIWNNAKKHRQALEVCLDALSKYPESWDCYYQAFTAAFEIYRKSAPAGIPALVKVHEAYELSGGPANNIGLYHRDVTRNFDESLKWYLKAAEREPNSQDIVNDAALIYLFHFTGEKQKKCLPMFLKVISLVTDEGQKPARGFWDALENLCVYYTQVEDDPEKVVEYGSLRNRPYDGVPPYAISGKTPGLVRRAQDRLDK